jgi:hypothetical protein
LLIGSHQSAKMISKKCQNGASDQALWLHLQVELQTSEHLQGRSKDQQYTQVPRHLRNWRLQAQQRQPEPENSQGFQWIPMDFKMEMGPKNTWAFQDWEAL